MSSLAGVLMALAGGVLALLSVRRARAATPAAAPPAESHAALQVIAEFAARFTVFLLGFIGAQAVLAFLLTRGFGVVTAVDLLGFLVLLGGTAAWVKAGHAARTGAARRSGAARRARPAPAEDDGGSVAARG